MMLTRLPNSSPWDRSGVPENQLGTSLTTPPHGLLSLGLSFVETCARNQGTEPSRVMYSGSDCPCEVLQRSDTKRGIVEFHFRTQ